MAITSSVPTHADTMSSVLFPEDTAEGGIVVEGFADEDEVDVAPDWTTGIVEVAVPLLICDLAVAVVVAGPAVNPLSWQ